MVILVMAQNRIFLRILSSNVIIGRSGRNTIIHSDETLARNEDHVIAHWKKGHV